MAQDELTTASLEFDKIQKQAALRNEKKLATEKALNVAIRNRIALLNAATEADRVRVTQEQRNEDLRARGASDRAITDLNEAEARKKNREVLRSLNQQSAAIARANALLREQDPLSRQLLKIEQDRELALKKIKDTITGDTAAIASARSTAVAVTNENFDLLAKKARDAYRTPFEQFVQTIPGQLGNALGQGIAGGFKNLDDIGRNLLRQLGAQFGSVLGNEAVSGLLGLLRRSGGSGTITGVGALASSGSSLGLFAGVPNLLSLDRGGVTKRDGPAFLHKDEFVAPVDRLRQMIREEIQAAGGGGGGPVIVVDAQRLAALGYPSPNAPLFRTLTGTHRSQTLQDKRWRGY